ncbi:DUF6951 family protein [Methanosalsum natronophilum]|uniref:DUF6951 family protein n=1 Tax=Methanosalsum natronophilum TaxID=768733 RepID=UPI00216A8EB0|nr:hypothetical protein [Methanosalsum natronophilum]MCS3924187.1 hypothetical protein [Methanosalsum natronophilum]
MVTEIKVKSNICSFEHELKGEMKGDKIEIDINSPCKKIQNMSHIEIPFDKIFGFKNNYVMEKAEEAECTPTCLVPCGILHICYIESGMMSKNLAKQVGSNSIEFE